MSRLVVVSNRVAPITEGEPAAGGLALGVLDALCDRGGLWFGWSGEIGMGEPVSDPARRSGEISLRLQGRRAQQKDVERRLRALEQPASPRKQPAKEAV